MNRLNCKHPRIYAKPLAHKNKKRNRFQEKKIFCKDNEPPRNINLNENVIWLNFCLRRAKFSQSRPATQQLYKKKVAPAKSLYYKIKERKREKNKNVLDSQLCQMPKQFFSSCKPLRFLKRYNEVSIGKTKFTTVWPYGLYNLGPLDFARENPPFSHPSPLGERIWIIWRTPLSYTFFNKISFVFVLPMSFSTFYLPDWAPQASRRTRPIFSCSKGGCRCICGACSARNQAKCHRVHRGTRGRVKLENGPPRTPPSRNF